MIEEKSRSPKASRRQRQAISEAPYYCTATRSKRRPSRWSPNHAGRVLWLNCDERSPNQANHGSWLYDPIPSRSSFSLKKCALSGDFLFPLPAVSVATIARPACCPNSQLQTAIKSKAIISHSPRWHVWWDQRGQTQHARISQGKSQPKPNFSTWTQFIKKYTIEWLHQFHWRLLYFFKRILLPQRK